MLLLLLSYEAFSLHDLQQLITALKQTENRWPPAAANSSFGSLAQIILLLVRTHRSTLQSPQNAEELRLVIDCLPLEAKMVSAFFFVWRVGSDTEMNACTCLSKPLFCYLFRQRALLLNKTRSCSSTAPFPPYSWTARRIVFLLKFLWRRNCLSPAQARRFRLIYSYISVY